MKVGYAVTNIKHITDIELEGNIVLEHLHSFIEQFKEFTAFDMPNGIVFHDIDSATKLFSSIPIPAYTNKNLIHIDPRLSTWKMMYLTSIEGMNTPIAKKYYENLPSIEIATTAAHEIVHHAEFFHSDFDDYDEESMWFEEGLCFYIPRKWMLSDDEYEDIMSVENELIHTFVDLYGNYTLSDFGEAGSHYSQDASYSALFYDYWRSTKAVDFLVEKYFEGDIEKLIQHYHIWVNNSETTLAKYFVESLQIDKESAEELGLK